MSPIHICHLGKYYPPAAGGIEGHVQALAQAQATLGAKVSVVCVNHGAKSQQISSAVGSGASDTVEEMDGPVRVLRLGRKASVKGFDLCPELLGVLHSLGESGVDLAHVQTPNPTMVLALALSRMRIPLVVTHQSDVIKQRVLKYALRPFEHRVYKRAAKILCSSPEYLPGSDILAGYRTKSGALPLGIDVDRYVLPNAEAKAVAARLRQVHGEPLWLCVGRLVYYKGLATAVRVLPRVPGRLMVIGSGPLKDELQKLARSLGVADRIVWWAYASQDELVGAYHAATAFWFPSNARAEGFGLVQVEAMASGCPVINTEIPHSGVAWVSRHDESGLTVPVDDPLRFAAAAQRLLNEPGLRERLGRGARRRATQEFAHRIMGRRSLEIYADIIGRTP